MASEFNPAMLAQVGQLPLMFTNQGLEQMDMAKQNDQRNLQMLMQEALRKQQMHDADLAQKGATLQGTMLGNESTRMQNEVTSATKEAAIKDKLLKFGIAADEEKLNGLRRKIDEGMLSPDETTRKRAQKMREWFPEIIEARTKHAQEMEKVRAQGQTQRDVANINAGSREKVAQIKALVDEAKAKASASKDPKDYEALSTSLRVQAMRAATPEERAYFTHESNLAAEAAQRIRQATVSGLTINTDPASAQQTPLVPKTGTPAQPLPVPAGRPTPTKQLPQTNSRGWVLMTDANGNKAYVSPDRTQFEAAQ